jgi:hypothetical protein
MGAGPMVSGAVSDQNASAGIARSCSALACGKAKCSARAALWPAPFPRQIRQGIAALNNRLMEQPSRFWRGHQRQHAARPGGFAKQRDVGGIAAEGVNVLLNPLQGGDLIEQREIIERSPSSSSSAGWAKKPRWPSR